MEPDEEQIQKHKEQEQARLFLERGQSITNLAEHLESLRRRYAIDTDDFLLAKIAEALVNVLTSDTESTKAWAVLQSYVQVGLVASTIISTEEGTPND